MIDQLLLCHWLIEPTVQVFEFQALGWQYRVLTADCAAESKTGQKALRLDRAEKVAQELLKHAWRTILIFDVAQLTKDDRNQRSMRVQTCIDIVLRLVVVS